MQSMWSLLRSRLQHEKQEMNFSNGQQIKKRIPAKIRGIILVCQVRVKENENEKETENEKEKENEKERGWQPEKRRV